MSIYFCEKFLFKNWQNNSFGFKRNEASHINLPSIPTYRSKACQYEKVRTEAERQYLFPLLFAVPSHNDLRDFCWILTFLRFIDFNNTRTDHRQNVHCLGLCWTDRLSAYLLGCRRYLRRTKGNKINPIFDLSNNLDSIFIAFTEADQDISPILPAAGKFGPPVSETSRVWGTMQHVLIQIR